jgi:hypothetical protein
MAIIDPDAFAAAGRRLRVVALLVLAVCVFGIFACDFLVTSDSANAYPSSGNSGFRFAALHEPPFLWLLSAFAILVWLLARRWGADPAPRPKPSARSVAWPGVFAAGAILLVAVLGALAVMHTAPRPVLLVNPLLAAISVLSLAGASARLWPGDVRRGRLAIAYLATSTQFLLVSMTEQSGAAYLCFNLLWLYLVLRDDRFGLAAAPWVGVAALGLQNPLAHTLFAAPFLLRLLRTRRLGWIGYYGAVYGAGALASYHWMSFSTTAASAGHALDLVGLAGADRYLVPGMNLSVLLTWQAPAMALFLVASILLVRSLKPAERDLAAGIVLTLAFFLILRANDGPSWGYQHVYPVLGSAALLAASATVSVAGQRGALVPRLVAASAAIALLIQLPVRATHAERLMRPRPPAVRGPSEASLRPPDAARKPGRKRR